MDERIKEIAERYGYGKQSRQLIEEMAELTQAVNKYYRKVLDFKDDLPPCEIWNKTAAHKDTYEYRNLVEEMADVGIMMRQVQLLLGITDEELRAETDAKLDRQMKRMGL